MLRLLRGREHHVLTGICLWDVEESRRVIEAVRTDLAMDAISDAEIERYIETDRWRGKAAGFGYQDANDWLRVLPGGSESNVVGLPMERLDYWLQRTEAWPRVSDTERDH
jgi:septum formation protein